MGRERGYRSNYSKGVLNNLSHKSKSNYSESVPDNLSHKSHRLAAVSQGLATRQYVFPGQILLLQMQPQKFHQLQRQSFDKRNCDKISIFSKNLFEAEIFLPEPQASSQNSDDFPLLQNSFSGGSINLG